MVSSTKMVFFLCGRRITVTSQAAGEENHPMRSVRLRGLDATAIGIEIETETGIVVGTVDPMSDLHRMIDIIATLK